MRNIRLIIAYEGTHFFGWEETLTGPSIEGSLRNVLERVLQEKVKLQAASRTDRGVHAEGQVVNFFTKKELVCDALMASCNALLPPTIRVLQVKEMAWSFHPTLDARGKLYLYRVYCGPVLLPHYRLNTWHVPSLLSAKEMKSAADLLLGRHDFSAFCNQQQNSHYEDKIRELISIDIDVCDEHLFQFSIHANHFLYKMARNLVGVLVTTGQGKLTLERVEKILISRDRRQAPMTAPAHGLTLKKIFYPQECLNGLSYSA